MVKRLLDSMASRVAGAKSSVEHREKLLLATGALLSMQQHSVNSTNLNDYEFRIFSQFGDDGIIQYLIKHVKYENPSFIEFGVEDYSESNTRFLPMHNNWDGFILDGSEENMQRVRNRSWYWKYNLRTKAAFIDTENVNELMRLSGFKNIGLLHIDIDGNDYYVLEAMDLRELNPAILILEYNSIFGNTRAITVPYNKLFNRTEAHYSNIYFGASLPALNYLAEQKGYQLVGTNLAGNNAYFVRRDLLNDRVKGIDLNKGFRFAKFRESRDETQNLTFISPQEAMKSIKGLAVWNVIEKKSEVF